MRSANPVLRDDTFAGYRTTTIDVSNTMTVNGVIAKTLLMLLLVLLTAGFTWTRFYQYHDAAAISGWMTAGAIGGFIVAMVTVFKQAWAPITAPIYALLEGLFIGGISAIFEMQYPGIAIQAVGLTFGTLATMLLAYRSGMIRATENFKLGVIAATGGIALFYIVAMVLGFFGIHLSFLYQGGLWGILFSLFVVTIAALNFIIDFDFIEQGAARGAPRYMEWYGAFAMMITLIWLYIEFLRLLAKARER